MSPTKLCTSLAASAVQAEAKARRFHIRLTGLDGVSDVVRDAFNAARSTWEGIITGYPPEVPLDGITIRVSIVPLDGVGGVLASACPTLAVQCKHTLYATAGQLCVDCEDIDPLIARGWFVDMLIHEFAHAIGFGTLWTQNGLYAHGSGRYTGRHALAAYRSEFGQPAAAYIPVELAGDNGTRNRHWDEADGGCVDTGIVSTLVGADIRYELMTGWFNGPELFISHTTRQQFVDLGYTVNDPEPKPFALRRQLSRDMDSPP